MNFWRTAMIEGISLNTEDDFYYVSKDVDKVFRSGGQHPDSKSILFSYFSNLLGDNEASLLKELFSIMDNRKISLTVGNVSYYTLKELSPETSIVFCSNMVKHFDDGSHYVITFDFILNGELAKIPLSLKMTTHCDSWTGEDYFDILRDEINIVFPHVEVSYSFKNEPMFSNSEYNMENVQLYDVLSSSQVPKLSLDDVIFLFKRYRNKSFSNELKAIGLTQDSDEPMNVMMWDNCMRISDLVSTQGHSGFSFSYLSGIMKKFFSSEPILSPLTGEDWEWNDVSHYSDQPQWQNNRMSSVFKELDTEGNPYCYWLDGTIFYTINTDEETGEKYKSYFTNSDSVLKIESFPWMPPEKQYVEVKESE
jgi:hypothetical protein